VILSGWNDRNLSDGNARANRILHCLSAAAGNDSSVHISKKATHWSTASEALVAAQFLPEVGAKDVTIYFLLRSAIEAIFGCGSLCMISDRVRNKIEEIDDLERLGEWLASKPAICSQVLAVRSSLRVLPLLDIEFSLDSENAQKLILRTFRANYISWATIKFQDRKIRAAENIAHTGSAFATPPIASTAVTKAVANSAAHAVDAVANANVSGSAAYAVSQASAALDDSWEAARRDLIALEESDAVGVFNLPLWTERFRPDQPEGAWSHLRYGLARSGNWRFWIDWYDGIASTNSPQSGANTGLTEEQLVELAEKPDSFWTRSPAEVDAEIYTWIVGNRSKDIGVALVPDQIDEPEAQRPQAVRFGNDRQGRVVPDFTKSAAGLLDDTGATDRYQEVVRLCERLMRAFDPNERGANAARELIEDVSSYRNALGDGPSNANADLLIPRGDALREIAKAHAARDEFSDLPEISAKYLLGLDRIVKAHNNYVSLDPVLAERDEGLLGPDARKNLVDPAQGQEVIQDAVYTGAASPDAAQVLAEEARVAPAKPDPEDRRSRRYSEGVKNFARMLVGNAWALAKWAWNNKVKIANASGIFRGFVKAAKWVLAHDTWLLEFFSSNLVMVKTIKQIVAFLKTLPL